jgi:hypothetical protein
METALGPRSTSKGLALPAAVGPMAPAVATQESAAATLSASGRLAAATTPALLLPGRLRYSWDSLVSRSVDEWLSANGCEGDSTASKAACEFNIHQILTLHCLANPQLCRAPTRRSAGHQPFVEARNWFQPLGDGCSTAGKALLAECRGVVVCKQR